jgi:broad specificity phosphatase PhoE
MRDEHAYFMSRLILVRHGQASFLESNYDKLSPKGEAQSRLLGEYWARQRVHFDRVYSGPRVRQRETARIVGEAYKKAGVPWPEPAVLDAFDEFRAESVIERSLPELIEKDQHIRSLHQAFQRASGRDEQFKTFQRMFEVVIGRWAAGEIPIAEIEPWADFCSRVQNALSQLSSNGNRGSEIAVFSSGGPVGVALQRALGLSTEATLKAAWMVRNCAYNEFLFSSGRFTLSTYNSCPHLSDPGFITYR